MCPPTLQKELIVVEEISFIYFEFYNMLDDK